MVKEANFEWTFYMLQQNYFIAFTINFDCQAILDLDVIETSMILFLNVAI